MKNKKKDMLKVILQKDLLPNVQEKDKTITILLAGHKRIGTSTLLNALTSISEETIYFRLLLLKVGDEKILVTDKIDSYTFRICNN